ncbi:thiosulfohydrolase SoxB [Methylobacterium sp. NEAU 140]|uniref:thiosulfohydrolase SoxB n=1 Tax=Methylobacterium sp. NEAU 140 TaxID=3064945 RepID=UPI002732D4A7|nr:thiosulfohydrolase SoxB [Methylobacterium sp. NEAU 140]MDP4024676.1 thiosulfohydrolase SoxB [Methylobacterium sp. NEAU 140]
MTSRRDFLQIAAATAALVPTGWTRAFAQQRLTQDDLLAFEPMGNVTLVHLTDIHAQLRPVLFREPSTNLGVGEARGLVPHVTGRAYLDLYGIPGGSPLAYALTPEDYVALARSYGRMGGLDRIATVLDAIRAERGDRVLFLDGGDTWQNSYTSMLTKGQDMVDCMALLKPDAMTGHWEFTLGTDRVKEIVDGLGCPFLGQNVRDAEWNEPAFEATRMFERGGAKVAVIGQAFPYTPIANPRWMIPNWSFGIREEDVQGSVDKARKDGADLVVLLSHNGFDVDRKLAARVKGIDVVLTGHTHDALPQAVTVGNTLLIASGSHGKFLTRVDLDVRDGAVKGFRSKLIPIFSDVIAPQRAMAAKIQAIREPHEAMLREELGRTEGLLYRRGNFNGTLDDLICDALLAEREAEIALSPGFRWGTTVLPGQPITREDVYNATAITYPAAYRMPMTGARLKEVLEDVADNLFNADPYYQQGGDMVRVGGVSYAIDVARPAGSRISDLTLLRTGKPIEAGTTYTAAGWASVNEGTEGPPIWDVVAAHIQRKGTVNPTPAQVTVRGA